MDYREKRIHGDRSLPIAVYETAPDRHRYLMNLHWHPEHEIIYVQSGSLALRLNDQSLLMREGDVAFVTGGTLHSAVPNNCRYTCVLVNLPLLLSASDACAETVDQIQSGLLSPFPCLGGKGSSFALLCEQIISISRERSEAYPFLIKGILFSFFGTLLSEKKYTKASEGRDAQKNSFGRLRFAVSYIEKSYASSIHLSDLAREANMTPNHFCKCFKTISGMTPFEFILQYRLTKALHALRTTDMSVTELALACGFNDASYFIRLFRRQFGETPNQYRRRLSGKKTTD